MGRKSLNWSEKVKVGQKFTRLTVQKLPELLNQYAKIKCKCDCGNETQVSLRNLVVGHTKSCGCLMKEAAGANASKGHEACKSKSIFHGDTCNEYWKVARYFQGMHKRCNSNYTKRYIKVEEEWSWSESGYQNFKSWLLSELARLNISLEEFNNMHGHELSVDRINNDSNYCSSNCRLATPKQQNRNTSRARKFCGKHIFDYADELGIPYKLAIDYYYRNEFGKLLDYYNYNHNLQEGGDIING